MKKNKTMTKNYLTTNELMDLLSCSRSTVERLSRSGKLKRYKLGFTEKGKTFYKKSEIDELFKPIN